MKATVALILAFIVFLVLGSIATLLFGPFDIYIALSLLVIIPFALLSVACWKRKRWGFAGSGILALILVVATPAALGPETTPLLLWETTVSTLLLVLIALEGFKAYLESKKT